jgi:hypothetical protein
MSNVNNAFGFKPLMVDLHGAPCRLAEYAKAAADAHDIFQWDLVTRVATSVASPTGPPALPVRGVKTFAQATPGTTLILGASLNYGKLSTLTYHYVVDTPSAIFAAMFGNDQPTAFTIAVDGGLNANVKNSASTALSHISAMYIDDTTVLSTATLDVKLINGYNVPPNAEGALAIVEVIINKHQLAGGSLGV